MGRRRRTPQVVMSDFACTECGNLSYPIPREIGSLRELGHLKSMYCPHCQKETNHAELPRTYKYSYEDFLQEFRLGRFVDGQRIKTADLMCCSKTSCRFNVEGKCWNANESHPCKHRILIREKRYDEIDE